MKAKVRENRLCFRCGGKAKRLENLLFMCSNCAFQWIVNDGTLDMWLPVRLNLSYEENLKRNFAWVQYELAVFDEEVK